MKIFAKANVYRAHNGSLEAPEHHQHYDVLLFSFRYKSKEFAYVLINDGSCQRWENRREQFY